MPNTSTQLPVQTDAVRKNGYAIAMASSIVAGAFVLAVATIMLGGFLREQAENPLTNGTMTALKEQLLQAPDDQAVKDQLKERIRQEDMVVRKRFFQRRAFLDRGAYLLILGGLVLIVAVKLVWKYGAEPYTPIPNALMRDNPGLVSRQARQALIAGSAITAGVLLAVAISPRWKMQQFARLLPENQAAVAGAAGGGGENVAAVQAGPEPTAEMLLKNWPGFRGPAGTGVVTVPAGVTYPKAWDGASGKNVVWKAELTLPGHNSPVVWENQVFLSGADAKNREIYCYEAGTGKLLWKQPVPLTPGVPLPEVSEDSTGFAPSTMACDGRRVFAIFPAGDLVCFDLSGKKLWARNLGTMAPEQNPYGYASSLLTVGNKVIVLYDQGTTAENSKSELLAFDGATGKPLWQAKRAVHVSWSTPIYVPPAAAGGKGQIITAGNPLAISHDPETGQIIWQAKCLSGEVAPSPVYANGVTFVGVERADLTAIKTDGKGDVTKTHILWKFPDDLPDIVSPLATGDLVFMVTTSGMLTCLDAKDGKSLWSQEIKGGFNASPSLVGQTVYLIDEAGVAHLFAADAKAFKEVGTAALGEEVRASPAFAAGKIFIRGKKNLYCIGFK